MKSISLPRSNIVLIDSAAKDSGTQANGGSPGHCGRCLALAEIHPHRDSATLRMIGLPYTKG